MTTDTTRLTSGHNPLAHSRAEDLLAILIGTSFIGFGMAMFVQAGLLTGGTAGIAFLLGTATAAAINATLTEAQVYSWGWRVPFVLSIVMTFIAVFIRRKLNDTPVYHELQEKKANNTLERVSSKDKLNAFILSFAFSALFLVSLYYFITYANNHLVSILGMSKTVGTYQQVEAPLK